MSDDLFGSVLTEIANQPKTKPTGHSDLTEALMRRLAEKGLSLAQLSDRRMMDRSQSTLEANARKFGIAFPDYVPMALRRKVEFVRMGDFYEVIGDSAQAVGDALGVVVIKARNSGDLMCGVPVHAFEEAKTKLSMAFIVKVAKAKKERKRRLAA